MTTEKFYRAAQKGLRHMNCGSFYSPCNETAQSYVNTGDELYSFDLSVSLFDLTPYLTICDFDLGLTEIFELLEDEGISKESVFYQNDGVRIDCGHTWLVILFGQVDIKTSTIKKLAFEDMILEDEINEIVK